MDYGSVIFLLTGAFVSVAKTHQYHFINTPLNWTEAQSFCRQAYTDLAAIENTANISAALKTTSTYKGRAWIGLYDDLVNGWRWSFNGRSSVGSGETEFRNWNTGYPRGGQHNCVVLLYSIGTWENIKCSLKRPFLCYTGRVNGSSSFAMIKTNLNWTDAQRYCRKNYVDLASAQNELENAIMTNISSEKSVWIGLHREKLWSDGSTSLFRNWAYGEPNSVEDECTSTAFHYSAQWSDENCSLSLPFICFSTISDRFTSIAQKETSITLQWNTANNVSFILKFKDTEIHIPAPGGDRPLTYTVSSLTAGTKYKFTLFSVFDDVRNSGVNVTAVTATRKEPNHIVGLNVELKSLVKLSDSDIESALVKFCKLYGLTPTELSVKVKCVQP